MSEVARQSAGRALLGVLAVGLGAYGLRRLSVAIIGDPGTHSHGVAVRVGALATAALRLMETALTDCPDEFWETDLWPDEAPTAPTPHGGLHGLAPWFLAYHALLTLDYDLTAEFEPWEPPPPFDENTYAFPNRMFNKSELLGYVDYCRGRVLRTLDALTEEMAAQPLPSVHRDHGMLFGVLVGGIPLHVVEHASQIRQFLTAAGVKVQPMPGDRGYDEPSTCTVV